eukprot:gene15189-20460_t
MSIAKLLSYKRILGGTSPSLLLYRSSFYKQGGFNMVNLNVIRLITDNKSSTSNSDDKNQPTPPMISMNPLNPMMKYVTSIGNRTKLIIAGSATVSLALTYSVYKLTNALLHFSAAGSMYYGYMGGIITAGTAAGMIYYATQTFYIHPDNTVYQSLNALSKDPNVTERFGKKLNANKIRAYHIDYGSIWKTPQIQLIYVIQGFKGSEGLVSVVCKKNWFNKPKILYLRLDEKSPVGGIFTIFRDGDEKLFTIKPIILDLGDDISNKYAPWLKK